MNPPEHFPPGRDVLATPQSRRAILKSCGAVLVACSAIGEWPRDAVAAPTVRVAPPRIARAGDCRTTVSVIVTLAGLARGARYEVYGDVVESDDPDGTPDRCCALAPRVTLVDREERQSLELIARVRAAELGLVRGIGPAGDETFSPDLVELFARIWLRDLTTAEAHGPWDSPVRVAVASSAWAWTQSTQFPGSDLLVPRDHMPPQACAL